MIDEPTKDRIKFYFADNSFCSVSNTCPKKSPMVIPSRSFFIESTEIEFETNYKMPEF